MKKLLIFISLFIASIYLSSAIIITLSSWQKLDNSSWNNLSSVLNKVDVSWSDLNINWRLAVDWKICDINNNCLGECSWWDIWDTSNNTCITPASTPETADKTCKTIKEKNASAWDWEYWINPDGDGWVDAFKVYCDMNTDWWGWTLVTRDSKDTSMDWNNNSSYYYDNYPWNIVGYRLNNANYTALIAQSTHGKHTYEWHTKTLYWNKSQLAGADLTWLQYTYCPSCDDKRWAMFDGTSSQPWQWYRWWAWYDRSSVDSAYEDYALYQNRNNWVLSNSITPLNWKSKWWATPYNMNLTIWVK